MNPAHAQELLARERARIEGAIADLAPQEDELEQGLLERLRDELAAVGRAEERVADGSYGLSVESGDPIPEGRLEAIPWAERTAEEQERYERR